jgi:hypothetical protein
MDRYREWRRAFDRKRGGTFSISVAEGVGYVEQGIARAR